jgi:hypothetical protein
MQFQVPQFIEVEDKIFGPLTFKQFIFLAGGAGMVYLAWRVLPLIVAIPIMALVGCLALALAFFQYNGRPFLFALETFFYYLIRSKLYLWSNEGRKRTAPKMAAAAVPGRDVYIPHLSDSKLHDLAWSLDIKERLSAGVGDEDDRGSRNAIEPLRTSREALGRASNIQ